MAKKKKKMEAVEEVMADEIMEMAPEAMEETEEECVAPEVIMEAPEVELPKEEKKPKEKTSFEKLTPQQLQELQGVANRFSFMKIGRGSGKLTEEMFQELSKEGGFLGMLSHNLLSLFK